jgi:hypothetical protein
MNKPAKNLSASVHQRLLNKSRETNQPFNELIQYYGIERLLYRLSLSQYSRQFVLKGALMFKAWGMANFRPTRDVDLLGHALNTLEHIKTLFEDVCKLETEPDGLEFDKNVSVERIKEDAEYEGIRVNVLAHLDKTRIPVQVDIGFADVVTPAPQKMEYPILLDFPAPQIYGYPRETIAAEKFQAMIVLGMANSRMKDFYDLCMMFDEFEFDGLTMQDALQRTFQNRGTELPMETHVIFLPEFAENKTAQWKAFTRKVKWQDYADMKQVINTIKEFFAPIIAASQQGLSFEKKWIRGWR